MVFIAGMGMMQGMAASNTVIQTIVTDDKRGRVMSYYTMAFMGMAPFGSLLAGTMAQRVGAPWTVILNGAVVLVGAAWFATRLPSLRSQIRPIYQEMGIIPVRGGNPAMSDEKSASNSTSAARPSSSSICKKASRECPAVRRIQNPP